MAHKTKSGKTSDAWKNLEKAWAKTLETVGFKKAKRISRAGDIGRSDHDVNLPEIPNMKSDCKYKNGGWSFHTIFKECEAKYVKNKSDFLVLPTKSGGEQGFLVTLRGDVFAKILAKAYLGDKKSSAELSCPACSAVVSSKTIAMDLEQHNCPDCNFEFISKRLNSESNNAAKKEG
jgi:hypothetical protein